MAEDNIIGWFTANGQHIPIHEGESKDEIIKERQIAQRKAEADKLNGKSSLNKDGETNKDGSMTIGYLHVSQKTVKYNNNQFGQDLEPAGEYMTYIPEGTKHIDLPTHTYGTIHFSKPLIIEHKSTGANGWKKDLSERYGGKTGKSLSTAIKKDGYDAVVTWEEYRGNKSWVEIVNLNGKKG